MDTLKIVFQGADSLLSPTTTTVPTLQYLVSQSLAENKTLNPGESYPDTTEHLSSLPLTREEKDKSISQDEPEPTCEGCGDIVTSKEISESNEIGVNNLLSAAYTKGTQWLQAGADFIFGEEEGEENKEDDPEDVEVTEETFEVVSQSTKVETDKIPLAQVDDTAYYNGYCIHVKGHGMALDTLFVNGSGPSKNGLEIRVSLLRDPTPSLHATIHAFYDPDENKLAIKYYHGVVQGLISVTCPQSVNVNDLKNDHKGDYIVITSP